MTPPKKKVDPESFFLCRIVGNDLVPRHTLGQSRTNVLFTLEHEPELEGCEKFWILNRIIDECELAAITSLLDQWNQKYLSIPFDLGEYAKIGFDYSRVPPGADKPQQLLSYRTRERLEILTALRRLKNNAAINNNGARNTALALGKTRARWVLPWDGNCFLTQGAWRSIRETVLRRARLPYFIVPMARMVDNSQLLQDGFLPDAKDEPQIIFRNDAQQRFDENYPYGHRPKVELLWRLGVPGPWDRWPPSPFEMRRPKPCLEAGKFATAGWVARLSSGNVEQETGYNNLGARSDARALAIIDFIDQLDRRATTQTHGGQPDASADRGVG